MRGTSIFIKRVILLAVALWPWAAMADDPPPASCAAAGHAAEQAGGLPENILLAIGKVESGRADPATGQVTPWPWTVNADGQGRYFENKADAVAFVRLALSSGVRDVDVGCFQISLQNHPDAFATLEDAFDPAQNAAYAAAFLARLKSQTGAWESAIADYHSATPGVGLPYERLVLAAWHGGHFSLDAAGISVSLPDRVVILQTALARSVHVYTLADPPTAGLPRGLPRVITP